IDLAPINAASMSFLQYQIQPDPGSSAIAFHERVGNIHFRIFVDDALNRIFRHFFHCSQRIWQKTGGSELKATFADVFCAYKPREIIQTAKKVGVYLLQTLNRAYFNAVDKRSFK